MRRGGEEGEAGRGGEEEECWVTLEGGDEGQSVGVGVREAGREREEAVCGTG